MGSKNWKNSTPVGHFSKWPLKPLKLKIQPGKQNIRVQRPKIIKKKVFANFSSKMPQNLFPMKFLWLPYTCHAKIFKFFWEFPACGYIRCSTWFLPDSKYVIFLLVTIICTML